MSKNHYPGANTTAQYWAGVFVGSTMNTNCACLHTTETSTWPGYGGGASAPHMTIRPNIAAKTVSIRQHFPAGKSSRALVNLSGGVETNTLNVFQIELIGTCDSRYRVSRAEWGEAGVDYIYWPDAPDWLLEAIAPVFKWLDAEWPDFKIADATPRGWVSYPSSYGLRATQRMTFSEWSNAYGIFGHQHVPENTHGDPGNFPIAKLIGFAKLDDSAGGETAPIPEPTPPPTLTAEWGKPETWKLGATGPDVLRMGQRINAWNAVLGKPTWTPDDIFSSTERNDLSRLQVAWGFGNTAADLAPGGASDGYPGALTFAKLDETPAPIAAIEPATKVTGLHWNIAGSDIHNGYKAENGTRGDDVARHALDIGFEVFLTCEASQSDLRAGMNTVIGNLSPWMRRAKGIWHKSSAPRLIGRRAYPDSIYAYLSTLKWGGAFFGIKDGKKYAFLEIHTDYRAPAKQAGQVRSITKKFWADTDALGIPRENTVICGDLNWDGSSGDNPFKALEGYGFVEKGNRTIATFLNGRHLDGILAHKGADVTVTRPDRANADGVRLSDHFPLKFVITLK